MLKPQTSPQRELLDAEALVSVGELDGPNLPIGIIVLNRAREERVVELIPVGVAFPHEFRGRFAYAFDNMTAVRAELTVGSGETRETVTAVGKVELTELPPRRRGTPIHVLITHTGAELEVRVIDVETHRDRTGTVRFRRN